MSDNSNMSKGEPGFDGGMVNGQIQTPMCDTNVGRKGGIPDTHSYKSITGQVPTGKNIMGPGTEHNDKRKY